MYRHTGRRALEAALARAREAVAPERARYAPFYAAVERYAAAAAGEGRRLVVGGALASRYLLGEPFGPDDYLYHVYSADPLRDAKALAAAFYAAAPAGLGLYTSMRTERAYAEFVVAVDGRPVAVVRRAELEDIVPARRPARFAGAAPPPGAAPAGAAEAPAEAPAEALGVPLVDVEVRLLEIYRSLCDYNAADAWPGLVREEAALRALLLGGTEAKLRGAAGAPAARGGAPPRARVSGTPSEREALGDFAARRERVLVGRPGAPAAAALAAGPRLQLATARPLEDEAAELVEALARAGVEVETAARPVAPPGEANTRRLLAYAVEGTRRRPLLEVFDFGLRETIPYLDAAEAAAAAGGISETLGAGMARHGGRSGRARRRRRPDAAGRRGTAGRPGARGAPRGISETLGDAAGTVAPRVATPPLVLRARLLDLWVAHLKMRTGGAGAERYAAEVRALLADYARVAALYDAALAGGRLELVWPDGHALAGVAVDPRVAARREKGAARGTKRTYFPDYFPVLDKKR